MVMWLQWDEQRPCANYCGLQTAWKRKPKARWAKSEYKGWLEAVTVALRNAPPVDHTVQSPLGPVIHPFIVLSQQCGESESYVRYASWRYTGQLGKSSQFVFSYGPNTWLENWMEARRQPSVDCRPLTSNNCEVSDNACSLSRIWQLILTEHLDCLACVELCRLMACGSVLMSSRDMRKDKVAQRPKIKTS